MISEPWSLYEGWNGGGKKAGDKYPPPNIDWKGEDPMSEEIERTYDGHVQVGIYLKGGQFFWFECSHLEVLTNEGKQRVERLDYVDASPALAFLHLDNIAAILVEVRNADPAQPESESLPSDS